MKHVYISNQDEEEIRRDALNAVKELTDNCLTDIREVSQEKVEIIASKGNEVVTSSIRAISLKATRAVEEMDNHTSEYQNTIVVKSEKRIDDIREVAQQTIGRIACKGKEVAQSSIQELTSKSKEIESQMRKNKNSFAIKVENTIEDLSMETRKSVQRITLTTTEIVRQFGKRPIVFGVDEDHTDAKRRSFSTIIHKCSIYPET